MNNVSQALVRNENFLQLLAYSGIKKPVPKVGNKITLNQLSRIASINIYISNPDNQPYSNKIRIY